MLHPLRRLPWLVLTIAWALLPGMVTVAAESPSGTVSIETTSVAAGIGVEWGDGTLSRRGQS
jgi:hypothetical protein